MEGVRAEINNEGIVRHLTIPRGEYLQFRLSGFGYGDEAIEDDIAKVTMNVNISVAQEVPDHLRDSAVADYQQLIDIFVFEHSDDYICYVQKVH